MEQLARALRRLNAVTNLHQDLASRQGALGHVAGQLLDGALRKGDPALLKKAREVFKLAEGMKNGR